VQNEKYVSREMFHASRKTAAAFLSGILFFCAFPPFEYFFLAWLAPVPLIYLCFCSKPRESFRYGFLAGAVFWLASIFWLTKVSFIGWFFIALYCALYFAVFAFIVSWWFNLMCSQPQADTSAAESLKIASVMGGTACRRPDRRAPCPPSPLNPIFLFGLPAVWVGLEYIRAHFLTGFPWNLLGVSQYAWHTLIQCADWGGVYLVSYLIVMGNVAFALLIYNRREAGPASGAALVLFLLIFCLVLGYGRWRLSRPPEQLEAIRAAAVQLNVPQQFKWSEDWANDIYRRLRESTAAVCKTAPPDLIVWPETALPDFMRYCEPSRKAVHETLRFRIPLLVGSMDYELLPGRTNYFNSSFLIFPAGRPAQVYEKRHLVIFGEYVPLADYLPFLRSIAGVEEDFTPGTKNVVFRLNNGRQIFSVLICFEDTLPYLARECVRAGARLLINQTNDAWFDPSWASRQHMAHCVFRCVENRVACLRAANTGLTCYIDRFGMIRSALEPCRIMLDEPQIMRSKVEFAPVNMPLTFYTRHGDLFAMACLAFSLPLFIGALLGFLRKR